jgi:hypothetical protein
MASAHAELIFEGPGGVWLASVSFMYVNGGGSEKEGMKKG